MKVFSAKVGSMASLVQQKRAICESFFRESHIFHQFAKVFSLESFPLCSVSTVYSDCVWHMVRSVVRCCMSIYMYMYVYMPMYHTLIPPGRGRGEGGFHRSPSYEEYSGGERGGPSGGYYYRGGTGEAPWGGVAPEGRGTGYPPTGNDVRQCNNMKQVRNEKDSCYLSKSLSWRKSRRFCHTCTLFSYC